MCADLHTHLQNPQNDALDSNIHHAYIWRSYPSPAVTTETENLSAMSALGCLDEENKSLDVGSFVCWIADYIFPLLGNDALLMFTVPLIEELISILLHPGCINIYSGVNAQSLSHCLYSCNLFQLVLKIFEHLIVGIGIKILYSLSPLSVSNY